jgi:methylthioxylose transferase
VDVTPEHRAAVPAAAPAPAGTRPPAALARRQPAAIEKRLPAVLARRLPVVVALAAGALVLVAAVQGARLRGLGVPLYAGAAPLFGYWLPHLGPGTPFAILLAVLVVARGPSLARSMPWPRLLAAGYATAVAWIVALATVDGWRRGFAGRLATGDEYLHEVPGVGDAGAMVRGFAGRILDFQPDSWTTHVAGHPPGALLVYVGLERIGLGGGAAAAAVTVLAGASVVVSIPVTLRALGAADLARAAVPFLALLPGAVWIGVSADGLFAGVTSAGVALVAVAACAERPARAPMRASAAAAVGGGLLLGYGLYLSYGLTLMALPVLAVLAVTRAWRTALAAAAGVGAVVVAFTVAGFWWLDGYHLVVQRYYQGIADDRPYSYWVWANLAALVLSAGPAAFAGLVAVRDRAPRAVACAALLAVVVADVSGLSKAETERIWLPFAVWLAATAAALPNPRRWLAVGAVIALAVNHLVMTGW